VPIFAATLYVFNGAGEVLLIRHPRMDIWCPPGGKIRWGELPHEAALRECREETGYGVRLLGTAPGHDPIPPLAIDSSTVNGRHLIQLVYGGVFDRREEGEEPIDHRWVPLAALCTTPLPPNVRERYWQFHRLFIGNGAISDR
jgi:ADP-ribose pyrophosphatase YjhB (NUDIX family)